jgi:transposase
MAPYSMDLRTRVLRDADAGLSSKELAAKYAVSRAWVDRLKQRRRETGEVSPRTQTKFRRRTLSDAQEQRLVFLITARPDATLAELREQLPTRAALSTLWRTIDRLNLTVKKRYTPTNSGVPTSPLSAGAGAPPRRCMTCAPTCFSMNAA